MKILTKEKTGVFLYYTINRLEPERSRTIINSGLNFRIKDLSPIKLSEALLVPGVIGVGL